jgi:energy-coupling factor transport system permease protein
VEQARKEEQVVNDYAKNMSGITAHDADDRSVVHPTAWLIWTGAALAATLITQNPLYQTLVLLAVLWVRDSVGTTNSGGLSLMRLAPWILLFTTVANGLTIHVGETVLFRIPRELPFLGGAVTLEAITFGFITGYSLVTLLAVFMTFSAAADFHALLRMVPGFLFQAGLVTSIALAFVPQTFRSLEEIREAQQIRGHRFRGWRDLPPLFLPLLTMGLERSIELAEAMESRGFGGAERGRSRVDGDGVRHRLLLLGGLCALVVAITLLFFFPSRLPGLAVLAAALSIVTIALRGMGRKVSRTRYRPARWERHDQVLALASGGLAGGLVLVTSLVPQLFLFYPYPRITAPPFDLPVAAALLLLALPALLVPARRPDIVQREVGTHGDQR